MALTDAQLTMLASDLATAMQNEHTARAALHQAKAALATALGPGGSCVIKGRLVTANADGSDLTVSPTRVVV